ncbi:carboxylesterase [Williamsia sp. Leaf354]|uniref:alpha/beta fold hydrolase n=1 Tax=Williamsia sp. Leaf354 TaxID=1736349 RepID=UPI0006FB7F2E|nr:alpha/beta hydrolase [Williamsia sp. Leaf354]KQR98551.1 carboxylesterase [Williamsia sp. Leaf354]
MDRGVFLDPNIGRTPDVGHFRGRPGFERFAAAYLDGMGLLPSPDEVASAHTSFGRVRAYRWGTRGGTPLVLLAGRQASTPLWRSNIQTLVGDRDVWSLDSIGEPGASTQTAPIRDNDDAVRWIDEALAALDLEHVHLLGVSVGGWLVGQCVMRRPERVASAVLLDPANTFAPLTAKMIAVSMGSVIPGLPDSLRHRLLAMTAGGATVSDAVPEGRLIASGMRDFRQSMPQPARPSVAELRAITTPVLAIIAGESIVHDPQRAARTAREVPGAEVEVWAGASHAINGERPEEIAERVDRFIADLNP